MTTADSILNASSQLTADGRAALVVTPGYTVRTRRRVWRVVRTPRIWIISS